MYYPSARQKKLIRRAFVVAQNSSHRCRHGAIVWNNSHITEGFNRLRNDPHYCDAGFSFHAEQRALRAHTNPKRGYCISVRLNRHMQPDYAAPCSSCTNALKEANIKLVIYSDPDSITGFSSIRFNK